jgi:hypothetical protein
MTIAPSVASSLKSVTDVAFNIYPNPVQNMAVIESKQTFNRIEIFDVSGKMVLNENYVSTFRKELDLSTLNNGYYIIRIQDRNCPLIKQ